MSIDQAERWLYELEQRAVRLEGRVGRVSVDGMSLVQRAAGQERLRAAASTYNTIYGRRKGKPTSVLVRGCNTDPRTGATVRFESGADVLGTAITGDDGYAIFEVPDAYSTVTAIAEAGDDYLETTSSSITAGSSGGIQTLADLDHLCLSGCSSPVLATGQNCTLNGVGLTVALSRRSGVPNSFIAEFDVPATVVDYGVHLGSNAYNVSATRSGTTRITVYVFRHGTGILGVTVDGVFFNTSGGSLTGWAGDFVSPDPSSTVRYRNSLGSGFSTGTYTCGTLTGSVAVTGTANTLLGITSVSIG